MSVKLQVGGRSGDQGNGGNARGATGEGDGAAGGGDRLGEERGGAGASPFHSFLPLGAAHKVIENSCDRRGARKTQAKAGNPNVL